MIRVFSVGRHHKVIVSCLVGHLLLNIFYKPPCSCVLSNGLAKLLIMSRAKERARRWYAACCVNVSWLRDNNLFLQYTLLTGVTCEGSSDCCHYVGNSSYTADVKVYLSLPPFLFLSSLPPPLDHVLSSIQRCPPQGKWGGEKWLAQWTKTAVNYFPLVHSSPSFLIPSSSSFYLSKHSLPEIVRLEEEEQGYWDMCVHTNVLGCPFLSWC